MYYIKWFHYQAIIHIVRYTPFPCWKRRFWGLPSAGLFGTAVATMGMLSTVVFVLAMDAPWHRKTTRARGMSGKNTGTFHGFHGIWPKKWGLNGIQLSKHGDIIIKSNACFDDIESDALYLAKLLDNLANSWAHNRYFLFEFYKGTKKLWASLDKKKAEWCSYNVVPVVGRLQLV